LKQHNIDQIHSKDSVLVQGKHVPLTNTRNNPLPASEAVSSFAYVAETTTIPAYTQSLIPLNVTEVEAHRMSHGDGFLTGNESFMKSTDTSPWLNVLTTCDEHGTIRAGVMNTLDQPVTIKQGVLYGSFVRRCSLKEKDSTPWRICSLDKAEDEKHFMTVHPEQTESKSDRSDWTKQQKCAWLQKQFKLNNNPCLPTLNDVKEATDLLLHYWDLFSHDGSFGQTHLVEHEIFIKNGPPIKQRNRPINPNLEGSLKAQVNKWLAHGTISKSTSPWNFQMVAVPKKNGNIRWCVGESDAILYCPNPILSKN
jgi:hypothetical protein